MQWSVTDLITHFAFFILMLLIIDNVGGFKIKNQDTTIYNRMICENEKLQIDCKESGKVLNIQRAYYGRYSITPCNKNHIQYTMGCTANNTLDVLKKLCQSRASCDIHATNSIFGDPCRNSTNVLELIYNCYDEIKNENKVVKKPDHLSTKYIITNFITPSIESTLLGTETSTVNNIRVDIEEPNKEYYTIPKIDHETANSIEEIFNYKEISSTEKNIVTHVDVTTSPFKVLSAKSAVENKIKCLFSNNQNITEHFKFGNHAVYIDQLINIPCSVEAKGLSGTKLYICKSDGRFHYVNSTCVETKNLWLESFESKINNKANSMKLMEIMNHDLKSNRSDELLHAKKSIGAVVDLFKNASVNLNDATEQSKNVLVETADTIIDKSLNWKEMPQKDRSKSATKLLDVVENIIFQKIHDNPNAEAVYNDQTKAFSIRTKNILAEVSSNYELKKELDFPSNKDVQTDEFAKVTIENPDKNQKFMFVIYKNVNELFSSENDLIDSTETKQHKASNGKKIIVNSNIISFKMNNKKDISYLKRVPIELTFKHLQSDDDYTQNEITPICSYWKFDKKTYGQGHWSPDGCHVKNSNRTHTVCQCNHLTHFAILMDIYGVHEELTENHEITLTVITIICSFISCISIVLTLLAFRFVKIIKKNREQSTTKDLTTITTHLCGCLLISLVLFLTGIAAQKLGFKVFCSSIALLTHYFFLCSFFWMLLEGVQLYFMLVRIFILNKSPVKRFCFIAYGLPFLIVLGSKLIDIYMLDSLGYGTANHCWISNYRYFNLTFIIPVTLILSANFLLLIIVIYGMRNTISSRRTKLSQKQDDFFKSLFGFWCIIITLLGLPWIIGYLIIDTKSTLVFSYLFTIINSSQGTIVFLFHCIVSKSVREEILKLIRKRKKHILSKESEKTTSLFCFPSSKSRSLQRGPSDSSSFKSPRKFFDSVRLIDRKGSNCSGSQTNSVSTQNKKGYNHHNPKNISLFNNIYQLMCFCFIPSEDLAPQEYKYNKNVKTSQSFSNNSRSFNDTTQSPLRNYSSTLSAQKSLNKTFNDEASVNLLPSEPCYNCQNIICSNGLSQTINKQILNSTLNREKPTLLQMYLTNEASKNLYNQKYLYGNMHRDSSTVPNASKMNRTSSRISTCSSSSNNPTQTTYLSPISSSYLSNNTNNSKNLVYINNYTSCQNCNSGCQIPSMPPPPLPPYNTNQFNNVNIPPSKASFLRNKESFVSNASDRFSTFKNSENIYNFRLPPVPSRRDDANKKLNFQDENQYLQPEFNAYSMVDTEYQSETPYYCDDAMLATEENSNMYSEVVEDYMEDIAEKNYRKNNSQLKMKQIHNKDQLKDLIAMPEEYDKDESVEHSHISDQDLFNMTTAVLKKDLQLKVNSNLLELDESTSETASDSQSSVSSDSSTLLPASSVLNGLFTHTSLFAPVNEIEKAQKL